jgi:hypothetical protein
MTIRSQKVIDGSEYNEAQSSCQLFESSKIVPPINDFTRLMLIVLMGIIAGCQTQESVPTATPQFASLAGTYECRGFDQIGGPYAGAGSISIEPDGRFEYLDYYPSSPITGHLEWVNETELRVIENIALISIALDTEFGMRVVLREGAYITHGVAGYIECG